MKKNAEFIHDIEGCPDYSFESMIRKNIGFKMMLNY